MKIPFQSMNNSHAEWIVESNELNIIHIQYSYEIERWVYLESVLVQLPVSFILPHAYYCTNK